MGNINRMQHVDDKLRILNRNVHSCVIQMYMHIIGHGKDMPGPFYNSNYS